STYPQGMRYAPPAPERRAIANEPSAGTRIARGLGWGILYGQCWTLWFAFRLMMAASMSSSSDSLALAIAVLLVIAAVGCAFLGGLAGLLIGAMNATEDIGAGIGIVIGLGLMGVQYLIGLRTGLGLILGFFFALALGRFVGSGIANKINQTVGP